MATCYRHPDRETGVSCSNCGRPICPDCMTPSSVGMRCPECSKQTTKVRTMASVGPNTTVVFAIIAINVIAFIGSGMGRGGTGAYDQLALFGPAVADGELWRLITSGFMHAGLLHIAFNMYALYFLGPPLLATLGTGRFLSLYFAALLCGSLGAIVQAYSSLTVGASGAIFGLMGATVLIQYMRGIDPWRSGVLPIIAINLVITFSVGNISIGGHLGGLAGGLLCGGVIELIERRRRDVALRGTLACSAIAVLAAVGAYAAASAQTVSF